MHIHKKSRICCWHDIHFDIQIYIRSHKPCTHPYIKKTRICCWHDIHFDIQIYIQSRTPSTCPYIKRCESAAGMIFISIFKSIFNLIDIHMPIHKKTRICCWHEIHFDIQIYIQSYTPSIFPYIKTRICCWHEIHFDIQIYILSPTLSISPYIKNRESAAGMIFISIFKSIFNLIDIHMPIHKKNANLLLA